MQTGKKPHIGPRPAGKPLTPGRNREEVITLRDGSQVVIRWAAHRGKLRPVVQTPEGATATSRKAATATIQ